MKKTLLVLVFGIFCVSLTFSAGSADYYSYSYARLSYVNGDVFIQRADDLGYEEGVVNLALVQGDKMGTREGRAEIHFGKRNYLRIDRQTQLDLVELPRLGFDQIQIHLLAGDIFLRVNYLGREKDIEIHTPDASYYILEEGLYRLSVRENMQTELLVFEGQIEAAGEEGSLVIGGDESLIAVDGFFSSESQYYSAYDDSFSLWNNSRDEMFARYVATQYLPAELNEYEVELAYSGRWIYEAPHGYVWIPFSIHSNWRPYHYGRWVWYPIAGWMWISNDPWGWATYRYGRWHWRAALGWYWIPTTIWGPAWVNWHYGFDTIGWCPLSIWNRPVVIVNNIFYGRNYDSYSPVQSRALTVINKNQLQARNISTVALSQERIGQMGRISLSERQPDLRPVVDRDSGSARLASQAMSRRNIREVQRSYSSPRALDSQSRIDSRAAPRTSSGAVSPGIIKRNTGERSGSADVSRPDPSSRTIRTYGSTLSRESADRSSRSGQPEVSARERSTLGTKSSTPRQGEASRSVPRYAPSGSRAAPENRTSSSRSTATPAKERPSSQNIRSSSVPSRSAVSSRSSSSSKGSASSESARSKATEKKVVKRYIPSASASSSQKTNTTSQNRNSIRSNPQRYPSSPTQTSPRGRSSTAPSRTSISKPSSSPSRVSTSRSSSRTSTPTVRRSSTSTASRSSSVRTPVRSSSSSSRSSSVRTPTRSSSSSSRSSSSVSSSASSQSSSSSRGSSASSRSTSSRSTSSRVKKK
jgi:hypothetical protein